MLKIVNQLFQVSEITGLSVEKGDISISDDGLNKLIRNYCRESGVRNLRKHIEKIFRKLFFVHLFFRSALDTIAILFGICQLREDYVEHFCYL